MQLTLKDLSILLGIAAIAAAGTRYIYLEKVELLEQKLSLQKTFIEINLPTLSKSMIDASADLSAHIKTLNDIKDLKAKNNELNTLYSQAEADNESLKDENKSLIEKLQSLSIVDQSFTLKQGFSRKILSDNYSIGVKQIYYDDAEFTFENKNYRLPVGSHIPLIHEGLACKIVVDSISRLDSEVGISLVCKKNKAAI